METKDLQKHLSFIEQYSQPGQNAATASKFDSNANVTVRNISTLQCELGKKDIIDIRRAITANYLEKLYGKDLANQYFSDLSHHIVYAHDESSLYPYCCSISLYPFLLDGLLGLGGSAVAPKHADSFIGGMINLVYLVASQFAGACMYKNQPILIKDSLGVSKSLSSKQFINSFLLNNTYSNYQGEWEYKDISNLDYYINEDNRLVKINKVMRRKYNDFIYSIHTKDGHTAEVSKDHIFKVLYGGRMFDVKAENLKQNDTVFMDKDSSIIIDKENKEYGKGFLTGALCGGGCITQDRTIRLSVCPTQAYVADIFNTYLKEIYNTELTATQVSSGAYDYRKYNENLYDNLCKDIIGRTSYDKHLNNIQDKSLNYLAGFLDGLFITDGSYSANKGIRLQLTNLQLIQDVEQILSILQISHNKHTIIKAKQNKKEAYSLYIPNQILSYIKYTQLKRIGEEKTTKIKNKLKYCYSGSCFKLQQSSNKRYLWSDSNQTTSYKTDIITSIDIKQNDDEYVYEIETDSHWYNCGGFVTHNCAIPEFLTYFDYFLRKDYGQNYIDHLKDIIEPSSTRQLTLQKRIEDWFQQFVYSINQPAGARNYQSPFTNIAYFDSGYFHAIFKDFIFPDGDEPCWETTKELQKLFMKWFNKERTQTILTFPVETVNMLCSAKDEIEVELEDGTILNFLPEQEIKVKYNNDIIYILAKDLVDNFDKYEIIKDN